MGGTEFFEGKRAKWQSINVARYTVWHTTIVAVIYTATAGTFYLFFLHIFFFFFFFLASLGAISRFAYTTRPTADHPEILLYQEGKKK